MALTYLIAGLILFLGVHSTRVFANDWRNRTLARLGQTPFKGVYALASLAGFLLMLWGLRPGAPARRDAVEPARCHTPHRRAAHAGGVCVAGSNLRAGQPDQSQAAPPDGAGNQSMGAGAFAGQWLAGQPGPVRQLFGVVGPFVCQPAQA